MPKQKSDLHIFRHPLIVFISVYMLQLVCGSITYAQTELAPWGNITGIRIDGQLMNFESSLRVVENNWSYIKATARERQRPTYLREGNKQIVTTKIDSITFTETIEDIKNGTANVDVQLSGDSGTKMNGAFFSIALPVKDYSTAVVKLNKNAVTKSKLTGLGEDLKYTVREIQFTSSRRTLELEFNEPTAIIIKKDLDTVHNIIQVYIPLAEGDAAASTAEKKFTIKATGYIDNRAISFHLNTLKQGPVFDGFGGNFRLQNPKADPRVIDYCLENLRVAWSRIELPWMLWQPEIDVDPVAEAKKGNLNPRVQKAMGMADRLHKMGIPIILSAWFPPKWAVIGELNMRPINGVWGNQLDSTKMNAIYKSITNYILYLKSEYGVDISFFSFNESDLGINVRQTAQEHDALIKGLGAYFRSNGLNTKMLLGDNSDATTYDFIYPAMNDTAAIPYIGAVSFHSWRGWDTETLEKWRDAATKLKVPLIVGEGSIDAAAWNYPAI
nr:hypothetical protein [Bacteroidota bacterium]